MKNKYLCLFPVLISCTLFTGCGITIGKVTIGTKDTIEYDSYLIVILGSMDESLFMEMLEAYIEKEYTFWWRRIIQHRCNRSWQGSATEYAYLFNST